MKIEIEDLKKIQLKPGEILLFKYDENKVFPVQFEESMKNIAEIFPDNKILYSPNHVTLDIIEIKKEEMNKQLIKLIKEHASYQLKESKRPYND